MIAEISIDRHTGSIRIGNVALLSANQTKESIAPQVADLISDSKDQGNGYEWLTLRDVTFGGQPATLSICFYGGRLQQADWSVQLPDALMEGGWPTQDAIDSELSFVRDTLARDMKICAGNLPWGVVWSHFDAKGFMAANGLRYSQS